VPGWLILWYVTNSAPSNTGNVRGKALLGAVGVLADVAAVVLLLHDGIRTLLVVLVAAGILGGVAALLAPKRAFTALGIALLVISVSGGVLLLVAPDGSTADTTAAASPRSTGTSAPDVTNPATTTTTTTATTTTAMTATIGVPANEVGPSGQTWYPLTAYESVDGGNGFDAMNTITIGSQDFPDSFRGYYPSSTADPNDRRTWLLGGKCSRLDTWVGKDAGSPKAGGTGRFIVKSGDVEIASAAATISTPPQHIDITLAGVVRLTLFDVRGGNADAYNAWGSPKVLCSAPPGRAR
jgi:hypothetical protein